MPVPKFLRGALVLALFALSCSGSGGASWSCSMPMRVGAPPAGEALVLRNFTLIDGGDHAVLSPAAMVIEGGRLTWVGPQSRLEAPDGALVTDLNRSEERRVGKECRVLQAADDQQTDGLARVAQQLNREADGRDAALTGQE